VRVYPERIVVAAEGQIVCEHARVFARSHDRKSTVPIPTKPPGYNGIMPPGIPG